MFQDEASFGRISKPRACWVTDGVRPRVPSHHIREYRYAYGAVDPISGDNFFIVAPYCNGDWMNVFFEELSKTYPDEHIVLVLDNAAWHTSQSLVVPGNIELFNIPPYTPEMNPIEQVWTELRKNFPNQAFSSLDKVIDKLCEAIKDLTNETVKSITGRKWILDMF